MTTESPDNELSPPQDEQVSEQTSEPPPLDDGGAEAMPDAESVDPLSAMAAGMDLNEVDPYLDQQIKAARSLDGLPEEEEEVPIHIPDLMTEAPAGVAAAVAAAAASDPQPFVAPPPPRPAAVAAAPTRSSSDRARAQAIQAAANSVQFKQFMIPVLMAVGVLLIGIGVLSFVLQDQLKPSVGGSGLTGILVLVVKYVAIPLGLLLLVGAFYFRMEVKRALRNKR